MSLQNFELLWVNRNLITQYCKANKFTAAVSCPCILLSVQYLVPMKIGPIIQKIMSPYKMDKLAACYILWFQDTG